MRERDYLKAIISLFLTWKILLAFALIFGFLAIPRFGNNFLGGGVQNYSSNPYVFAWGNFDGEHYLSIAQGGYQKYESAFFPVYPKLISFFLQFFPNNLFYAHLIGLAISNTAILLSLFVFWKILRLDYNLKFSLGVIVTLLLFPTSFYFQAVYNESVFLLLVLLSFYFARKGNFLAASIFGMFASATRIFGVVLFPALLIEAFQQKTGKLNYVFTLLVPLGLFAYMTFLWVNYNDPITFYHLQLLVGEQRNEGITFYPQVLIRYAKILINVDWRNTIYPTVVLEFICGVLFFLLPIYGYFKKVRFSYLFFAMACFIIPTTQGSFSSLPRYVLPFFGSFIALFLLIQKSPKIIQGLIFTLMLIYLFIVTAYFIRGYWVS